MKATDQNALRQLSRLLRLEGDLVTAEAIDERLARHDACALDADAQHRVQALHEEAAGFSERGDHARAEPLLAEALSIAEAALGPDHVGIANALYLVAQCHFDSGDYWQALDDFNRLLRLVEHQHEQGDVLVALTEFMIRQAHFNLRVTYGAECLQRTVDRMLVEAQIQREMERSLRQERMQQLAHRLALRGRHDAGQRLESRWIAERLDGASHSDQLVLADLRQHAFTQQRADKMKSAEGAFRALVSIRNRQPFAAEAGIGLLQALRDWHQCLLVMGQLRSASDTERQIATLEATLQERRRSGRQGREPSLVRDHEHPSSADGSFSA
jgi:tetratricopeptide (TPR) repeat protein